MRLLVDAHCFDSPVSEGVNTYIKGIYSQMPKLAPDIDFFFASGLGSRLSTVFGNDPNVHYIKLGSYGRPVRMLSEYPRIIRRHGIEAAHFQYFAPPIKYCPTIITLHDILFRDFPEYFPVSFRMSRDITFRYSARRADVLTTVSEYSRNRISHHYDIATDNILITPNAVSKEFFNVDREKARHNIYAGGIRPYILNVSRIEPRKNQLALVSAYASLGLADKGYDLVLINRRSIPVPELESFIAHLPDRISAHIHRFDGLPHETLPNWYAAASLFVYPSLGEGFGIPPLEAAAACTPVICNKATAMTEYDFFGHNLLEVSDVNLFHYMIKKNLEEPPSDRHLKDIARIVDERYNWRNSASTLLDSIRWMKLKK